MTYINIHNQEGRPLCIYDLQVLLTYIVAKQVTLSVYMTSSIYVTKQVTSLWLWPTGTHTYLAMQVSSHGY
jgi:hypothetical protein